MHYYLSRDHQVSGAFRALYRMLRFARSFLLMAVLVLAVRALVPQRIAERIGPAVRRFVGRRITAAAGVRVTRHGSVSPDATLVVSNHLSWLDAFVYLGELGPRFVAKSSWSEVPGLGPVLSAAGVIFIRRTRLRDIHEVGERLRRFSADGELAMVFPEANTSRGATILPFRPGLLEPAARSSLPVAWAALRYETPPGWPPASVVAAWGDWTPLLLHIYRAFYPPWIRARIVYGAMTEGANDRKELARKLHRAVTSAFEPMEQLPPDQLVLIEVPPPDAVERF